MSIPKHLRTPVVPVQLPAESLGVMRLSTSLVRVLIEGNFCDCAGEEFISQGRCAVEVSMFSYGKPTLVVV